MKTLRLAAMSAALCMALGAVGAQAADLARGDKTFMEKAARAGMFEIEASKLASTNADNAGVKDFASMMVTDHTAVAQELSTLAGSKGVKLPDTLPRGEQATLKTLGTDKGAKFDKNYTDKVAVSAHKDAVRLFTSEAKNGKDADVKAFAQKTLPALQGHLDKGLALQKTLAGQGKGAPKAPASGATTGTGGSAGSGTGTVSPASRNAPANMVPGANNAPAK